MSRFLGTNALVVVIALMSTLPVHAALVFWDNDSTDHDFTNPLNWAGDLYPLSDDYAVIQNNSYANISTEAAGVGRLYVGANQGGALDPPLGQGTGTLNILTGGSVTTTSTCQIGEGDGNEGTVNVAGGSLTTGAFGLGYSPGSTGTLNVSAGGTYATNGFLYVGRNTGAYGVLNLSDGSVTTPTGSVVYVGFETGAKGTVYQSGGTFTAGTHLRLGHGASSVGMFSQTGGTINAGTAGVIYAGFAAGAYGNYRLAGGEFTGGGLSPGAASGGVGVIEQEAGTVINIGTYGIRVGSGTSGIGLFNQKGGTANLERVLWAGGNGSGSWGQIELSGTTTVTAVEYTSVGRHAGSFGYLNLNATGTLTTSNVRFHATEVGGGQGVFTFHGGTLKANASTPDAADPATHFMRREAGATGDISILIGAEGGTIDTDGYDVVISEPLQAMTGHGVSSVSLWDSGSGYEAAPIVRISGGSGRGATALATVSGGTVTGITITNPGSGYAADDSLTVQVLGGGASSAAQADLVSLAPNAADGGLTKQGLGTLTLAGANTYAGLTTVQAGTLNLTGSLLGDVDVQTDAVLMGNSGTVGGNVDLDGTLGVAYNGDDDTIALLNIVGELDLTGATFSFSNVGAGSLAEGEYVFATYGSLTGNPAVHVGLQSGWAVDYTYGGNSIALLVTGSDPIPGDANNSGTVDEADAKYLAENWGKGPTATWEMGDFNGDGWVNAIDASILAAHWGMSGATEAAAVPEPSALIAVLGGLLSMAWIRRKR